MNLERKTVELKAAGDDGSFELYALAFNNVDRQGDIILPGAVSNVDELVKDGWGALNHQNSALPVAYAVAATQDANGLLVRGQFHSTPAAQECRTIVTERMAAGKSVMCSIGYVVNDASYETRGGEPVRILKSISVYEFSFVNLPANPAAGVVSAKSVEDEPMDETEKGILAALKRAMGLEAKKGKVISAANHAALSKHASGMADAVKAMGDCVKDFKAKHKALQDFLDAHAPGSDDDDGDEKDDDDTEAMAAPPVATKQTPPSREEIAREFAGLMSR